MCACVCVHIQSLFKAWGVLPNSAGTWILDTTLFFGKGRGRESTHNKTYCKIETMLDSFVAWHNTTFCHPCFPQAFNEEMCYPRIHHSSVWCSGHPQNHDNLLDPFRMATKSLSPNHNMRIVNVNQCHPFFHWGKKSNPKSFWKAWRKPQISLLVFPHIIDRRFAWQAWHLVTSTFALRGRRGTYGTGLALVTSLVPVWRRGRRLRLRGRHGTWWHRPSLCVAGVTSTFVLCSRLRTCGTGLALVTRAVPVWRRGRRLRLRGRHGTWWHRPSLCVAGVALGDIDLRFARQAWHLWHWPGSGGALGSHVAPWSPPPFAWQAWHLLALGWLWWRAWFPFGAVVAASVCVAGVALGRHRPSFCVAGVARTHTRTHTHIFVTHHL